MDHFERTGQLEVVEAAVMKMDSASVDFNQVRDRKISLATVLMVDEADAERFSLQLGSTWKTPLSILAKYCHRAIQGLCGSFCTPCVH